jgi:hypothetical protein
VSRAGRKDRSFLPITADDLERLAAIAAEDRARFFAAYPKYAPFAHHVLCTALCQGAAAHYLWGKRGINDFDVYTFFSHVPGLRWYPKRIQPWDFGDPKFGRSVGWEMYVGRRVDLLGRELDVAAGEDVVSAIRRYLRAGRTDTARALAKRAVVLLDPPDRRGEVVWPPPRSREAGRGAGVHGAPTAGAARPEDKSDLD